MEEIGLGVRCNLGKRGDAFVLGEPKSLLREAGSFREMEEIIMNHENPVCVCLCVHV